MMMFAEGDDDDDVVGRFLICCCFDSVMQTFSSRRLAGTGSIGTVHRGKRRTLRENFTAQDHILLFI